MEQFAERNVPSGYIRQAQINLRDVGRTRINDRAVDLERNGTKASRNACDALIARMISVLSFRRQRPIRIRFYVFQRIVFLHESRMKNVYTLRQGQSKYREVHRRDASDNIAGNDIGYERKLRKIQSQN